MAFQPLARKLLLPVLLALVMGASAALATGCSVSIGSKKTGGTYHKHGVSFKIPDGWRRADRAKYQTEAGNELWSDGFAPKGGADGVTVTAYATKVAVTRDNAQKYASAVASAVNATFAPAGGTITAGPTGVTMGGLSGYGFEVSFTEKDGSSLDSSLVMVWNGKTEYFVNCQHKSTSSRSAEIERGCKTIVNSFKLTAG